jgi:hypothetical protein
VGHEQLPLHRCHVRARLGSLDRAGECPLRRRPGCTRFNPSLIFDCGSNLSQRGREATTMGGSMSMEWAR